MPSEVTLVSRSGDWKAEVEAWKNNFLFYRSIGTQVDVYHREETRNVWGSTVTDWVSKPALSISIQNTYRGTGPGTAGRTVQCQNAAHCENKEWAVGVTLTLPVTSVTDVGGGAVLTLDEVTGVVAVSIPGEVMQATVTAGSAISDSSIW